MKCDDFPVGEPVVLTEEQIFRNNDVPSLPWNRQTIPNNNNNDRRPPQPFTGLLFVRIEPPRKMDSYRGGRLPPFLPYRSRDGNLCFPLCARCTDQHRALRRHHDQTASAAPKKCTHTSLERGWVDGLTHHDLNMAIRLGYNVHEVYEVSQNSAYIYKFVVFYHRF